MRIFYFVFLFFFIGSTKALAEWAGTGLRFGTPIVQHIFKSENKELVFEPNPLNEVTLNFIGPQYSFGLQFSAEKEEDSEELDSRYSDFLISFYDSSFIVDIFYKEFSDFYILSDREEIVNPGPKEVIAGSSIGAQTLFFLDDTSIFKIHGDYVLSPSPGVGFFSKIKFSHNTLEGENRIIPAKYFNDFQKINIIEKMEYDIIEGALGVSALGVVGSMYFNGYLMLGPSLESYVIETDETNTTAVVGAVGEAFIGAAYFLSDFQFGLRSHLRNRVSQVYGVETKEVVGSTYAFALLLF